MISNAVLVRSEADSNRCTRFCRPLPSHSAIRPKFYPSYPRQSGGTVSNLALTPIRRFAVAAFVPCGNPFAAGLLCAAFQSFRIAGGISPSIRVCKYRKIYFYHQKKEYLYV